MAARFETFDGEICGFGTTSGHRVVIGRWSESPFGSFADVMHEAPDGTRTLLAPNARVAEFVQGTYVFDRVEIVEIVTRRSADVLHVHAGELSVVVATGSRTALGWALHALPRSVARSRRWCALDRSPRARAAARRAHPGHRRQRAPRVVRRDRSAPTALGGGLARVGRPRRRGRRLAARPLRLQLDPEDSGHRRGDDHDPRAGRRSTTCRQRGDDLTPLHRTWGAPARRDHHDRPRLPGAV